jgi:hypothetical protein
MDRLRVVSESPQNRRRGDHLPLQSRELLGHVRQHTRLLLDGGDQAVQLRLETALTAGEDRVELGELAARLLVVGLALLGRGRHLHALLLFRRWLAADSQASRGGGEPTRRPSTVPANCLEAAIAVPIAVWWTPDMSRTLVVGWASRARLYAGTALMTSFAALYAPAGGYRIVSESQARGRRGETHLAAFTSLSETDASATLLATDAQRRLTHAPVVDD